MSGQGASLNLNALNAYSANFYKNTQSKNDNLENIAHPIIFEPSQETTPKVSLTDYFGYSGEGVLNISSSDGEFSVGSPDGEFNNGSPDGEWWLPSV